MSSITFHLFVAFFIFAHSPAAAADLLVAAASDLASAEQALRHESLTQTGQRVRFVFQSSGMLARQIQHGAPYDVYLSANRQYVDELAASGDLLRQTIRVYATGRLGLWSESGDLKRLEDLRRPRVRNIAIANPAYAPYGVAAKEALEHQGLWAELQPKIVLAENVRQTFQYGVSGNADAVITSWTLIFDQGGHLLPADWHQPIRQAGGVLRSSSQPAAARAFLDFLTSPAGLSVLERHGLFPPH